MVVRLRLARWGARNNPFYGIVAANVRAARDGKHLERLGTYNPIPDENNVKHLELDVDRIKYWLSVGAQPSDRVAWLLAKADLMPPKPAYLHKTGIVDINDANTWKVSVSDKDGNQLALLDQKLARDTFQDTELINQLPRKEQVNLNRIDRTNIDLSGKKKLKGPISERDGLLILKAYTGI